MSFDLSWLWNTLNAITSAIQTWFSSIWETVQSITNTGQGIFAGLANLGSSLWDAIIKAFQTLGSAFVDAFNWIWQGLKALGETLGGWLSTMGQWISYGIQWVGSALWSFGSWLYSAFTFIWNWVVNALTGLWSALTGFFSGLQSAIGGWWNAVVGSINAWFTGLIVGIRRKLIQTIMADVSIYFGWKSIERLINAHTLKDAGFSLLGLLASPFVGYMFGSIADGLIPSPSTEPIQLIPSIPMLEYSPPPLAIEKPTERIPPEMIPPQLPTIPPVGYSPIQEKTLSMVKPTFEYRWDAGFDKSLSLPSIEFIAGVLFEQNTTAEIFAHVYGDWVQGFTFTPQINHQLWFFIVKGYREGNPSGNLIVQLFNVDQDGLPTGTPILEFTIPASKIPSGETEIEFILPSLVNVYADTPIAIIFRLPQGDADNYINFRSSNENPYARGWRVWSNNGGQTWNRDDQSDWYFREYGL
ncbi:MAG: hypothetical protein QW734_07895 [Candidatus Bathyarchaeia archaeon]